MIGRYSSLQYPRVVNRIVKLSLSVEPRLLASLCFVGRRSFEKAATGVELLIHSVQQER